MTLLCTALSVLCVGVKCKILHFTLFVLSRVEFPGLSALTRPGFTPLSSLSPNLPHLTSPTQYNSRLPGPPAAWLLVFTFFSLPTTHPYPGTSLSRPSVLPPRSGQARSNWDEAESEVSADPVQWLQPGHSLNSGAGDTESFITWGYDGWDWWRIFYSGLASQMDGKLSNIASLMREGKRDRLIYCRTSSGSDLMLFVPSTEYCCLLIEVSSLDWFDPRLLSQCRNV